MFFYCHRCGTETWLGLFPSLSITRFIHKLILYSIKYGLGARNDWEQSGSIGKKNADQSTWRLQTLVFSLCRLIEVDEENWISDLIEGCLIMIISFCVFLRSVRKRGFRQLRTVCGLFVSMKTRNFTPITHIVGKVFFTMTSARLAWGGNDRRGKDICAGLDLTVYLKYRSTILISHAEVICPVLFLASVTHWERWVKDVCHRVTK